MNIDYVRLAAFLIASTFVMALATHLVAWIHGIIRRSVLRREAVRFVGEDRLFLEALAETEGDEAIEHRRAAAPRYPTYVAFVDAIHSAPLDEILDRCNGRIPDRNVQAPADRFGNVQVPGEVSFSNQWAELAGTIICGLIVGAFLGIFDPVKIEAFLKSQGGEGDPALDVRRKLQGVIDRMNETKT